MTREAWLAVADWDTAGAAAEQDLRAELAEDAARDEAAERGRE